MKQGTIFLSKLFWLNVFLNIKKDILFLRELLYVFLISVYGFLSFLLDFSPIKKVALFAYMPLLLYLLGTIVTQLPNYYIIIMSFFPPKYILPLYAICFVYIFVI